MTEIPELQRALVEAAARRRRRRRRLRLGSLLPVGLAFAAIAAALLIAVRAEGPAGQRPAATATPTPASTPIAAAARSFAVFRRAQTARDALPWEASPAR
jgi:hypothetical protein